MARSYNPKYEINIKSVFDSAYSGQSYKLKSKLKPILKDRVFRDAYAFRVIDEITKRTLSGIDKNGRVFPKYSESYLKSLVARTHGKSRGRVNLWLTGSMLSDLQRTNKFNTITFTLRSQLNKNKARGHISGMEGAGKKRDFFGLPKGVESSLLKQTIRDYRNNNLSVEADIYDEVGQEIDFIIKSLKVKK